MSENYSKTSFSSISLLFFLWRWRKLLIIVTIVTAIISIVVSLLLVPLYESRVVLLPASTQSLSKALLSEVAGPKKDIMEFGEEEQAEQLLQILHSSIIRDKIVSKYDLYNHYEISPNDRYRQTKLIKKYNKLVKFRRTKFMAVEIVLRDKDPQLAADMANDIAAILDTVVNKMQQERSQKAFEIVENTYFELKKDIERREDSLRWLRSKGVLDYESQAERLYEALSKELSKGNLQGIKALRAELDTLAKYGGAYVSIRDALEHDKKQLSLLRMRYEEAKIDAHSFIPHKFVVDRAYKAERKVYPIRSLIVIVSVLSSVFFTIVILLIIENFKNFSVFNKKII